MADDFLKWIPRIAAGAAFVLGFILFICACVQINDGIKRSHDCDLVCKLVDQYKDLEGHRGYEALAAAAKKSCDLCGKPIFWTIGGVVMFIASLVQMGGSGWFGYKNLPKMLMIIFIVAAVIVLIGVIISLLGPEFHGVGGYGFFDIIVLIGCSVVLVVLKQQIQDAQNNAFASGPAGGGASVGGRRA